MRAGDQNSSSQAKMILGRLAIDGHYGVFQLNCGLELRATIISQQIRAISLVSALAHENIINKDSSVAIIGAGIAGVTAAARAAFEGCDVTLLERNDRELMRFADSERYIHPHLFDWPSSAWKRKDARLPILNWRAGPAKEVVSSIARQWKEWKFLYSELETSGGCEITGGISCLNKAERIELDHIEDARNSPPRLTWTRLKTKNQRAFDVVILAIGLGDERRSAIDTDFNRSYWENPSDPEETDGSEREHRILISGDGDTALTRFLEHCIDGFQHEELLDYLDSPELDRLRHQVNEAEAASLALREKIDDDVSDILAERYLNIEAPIIERKIREKMATRPGEPRRLVVIRGESPKIYNLKTFPLNRFLVSRLERIQKSAHENELSVEFRYVEDKDRRIVFLPGRERRGESKIYPIGWRGYDVPEPLRAPFHKIVMCHGVDSALSESFNDLVNDLKDKKSAIVDTGRFLWGPSGRSDQTAAGSFYSDLFDNVVQREVYDKDGMEKAPLTFYRSRLRLELLRRENILITDRQLLDGAFFLDLFNQENLQHECAFFKTCVNDRRITLLFRERDVWSTLWNILGGSRQKPGRGVQFWWLGEKAARQVYRLTESNGDIIDQRSDLDRSDRCDEERVRDLMSALIDRCDDSTALKLETLLTNWTGCAEKLQGIELDKWSTPRFDIAKAFEDPGEFLSRLENSKTRNYAKKIFRNPWARGAAAFHYPPPKKPDKIGQREVVEWFVRAYQRAIARQHGASILETINVRGTSYYSRAEKGTALSLRPTANYLSGIRLKRFESILNDDKRIGQWRRARWVPFDRKSIYGPDKIMPAKKAPLLREDRADALLGKPTRVWRRHFRDSRILGSKMQSEVDFEFHGHNLCGIVEYASPSELDRVAPLKPT